jgi:LacI family transcriptional regulator
MNYVPNFSAKSLVQNRSYNIGLLFSTFTAATSSHFFLETIRGVKSAMDPRFNLVVNEVESYHDFQSIDRRRFDGIIIMSQRDRDLPLIDYLVAHHMPIVLLNRLVEDKTIPNVLSDDRGGAYYAVSYLIERGHQATAIIQGCSGFYTARQRKQGYLDAMQAYHCPVPVEYCREGDYTMGSGYQAAHRLLDLSEPPSAIFCSNDEMAIGALRALSERGLEVPKDISVVGFDDIGMGAFTTPALTTVSRPLYEIGKLGATRLLERIDLRTHENVAAEPTLIPPKFVERESVASIPS